MLTNLLYGLIKPDAPVLYTEFDPKVAECLTGDLNIIKTHSLCFNRWRALISGDVFFVGTKRGQETIELPRDNSIVFSYQDILETEHHTLERIVSSVAHRLKVLLPPTVPLDENACVARIRNMNARYEEIKHQPFAFLDQFYQLHGHHRSRPYTSSLADRTQLFDASVESSGATDENPVVQSSNSWRTPKILWCTPRIW